MKICPDASKALQVTVKIKQEGTRTVSFAGDAVICLSCYHPHDLFDKTYFYHGFRRHLDEYVRKAVRNVCMETRWQITFFPELNFAEFVNCNVQTRCRRLYLWTLKDVAWPNDAQLICLISHAYCLSVNYLAGRSIKKLQTNGRKITQIT